MIFGFIFMIIFFGLVGGGGYFLFKRIQKNISDDVETEKYIPTTQDNLPVDYIRDGIVKLKNGNFACVISMPSVNIDLMEDGEREGVFGQYRQTLSSIDFPFQILQQSRVADISDYLKSLEKIHFETKNKFIKRQIEFYMQYMEGLVQTKSVLSKKFFIIIPLDEFKEKKRKSRSGGLFDFSFKGKKNETEVDRNDVVKEEKKFEQARRELLMRAGVVQRSFKRFGVSPTRCGDDQVTELLYTSYNKNRSVYQPLPRDAVKKYSTIYVDRKGRR